MNTNWFSLLNGKMVKSYENISLISQSIYLISVDDGFVIFNDGDASLKSSKKLPGVLIRKLENMSDRMTLLSGSDPKNVTIPYSDNSIRITYTLPYYIQSKIKFQYYLEGYSKGWSNWTGQTQQEFTDLPQGDYIFKIRAQVDDFKMTDIAQMGNHNTAALVF